MSNKSWNDAWSERYDQPAPSARRRILPRLRRSGGSRPGRYAVLAAVVIAVVAAPFAVAATKGRFTNSDSRYTLLSRNVKNGDGGAMAAACTSNKNTASAAHEPCLNMVNKGTGYAAAFRTRGLQGFRLQTSGTGTATPFILDKNATGKVQYFNADQLDGKDSTEVGREAWALVDGTATAPATPALTRNYRTTGVARTTGGAATGDYTLTFADDVNTCSYEATSANIAAGQLVAAAPVAGQNKQVRVVVRPAGGGAPVDGDFQIAVHC